MGFGVPGRDGRRGSRQEAFDFLKLVLQQAASINGTASWLPKLENRAEFGRIPAARGPTRARWGQFPVSQERAQLVGHCQAQRTLPVVPGSSAGVNPRTVPLLPELHKERRAGCLGCGISQQVVSVGS